MKDYKVILRKAEEKEPEKFLVQILNDFEDQAYVCMKTSQEIISRIDMSDCCPEQLAIYRITKFNEVEKLTINDCWHNPKDPLYISITDNKGNIVFDGYGTDH